MIKLTKRSLLVFFISFALMFISASISHAEENPEEKATKLGISFPIAELGNCGNFSACKAFCDSEANKDACIGFAQKKGIKTDNRGPKDSKVIQSAQSELGCNSENSCRAICEQESNRDKCASFAQKHGLGGPRGGGPGDRNVLNKAKEILGCDSEASCKSVCENPANQEKCSNFAKSTGLGGGIRRVGPGGCDSEASCRAYCEANPQECGSPRFGGEAGRRGPSGSEPYAMPPEGFTNPETGRPDFDPDQQPREYTPPSSEPSDGGSSGPESYTTPTQEVRGISTTGGLLQQVFNQLLTLF